MSAPRTTKHITLAAHPKGPVNIEGPEANFTLKTSDLPSLKDNQVLLKTIYLSNDPAQRGWINYYPDPSRLYAPPVKVNETMRALGIGEVLESKSEKFPVGTKVAATVGWTEYAVLDAAALTPLPELPGGLGITHYLGALGGPGITAYYGLTEIAEAKSEDVVVVSGAAGATGSMAVQVAAKLIGCKRVIGIAGSEEKCRWVESLGAYKCLNYKSPTFKKDLRAATEGYVDVFFDNVGGEILDLMLARMAKFGRVALCGAISGYNASRENSMGLRNYFELISMRVKIQGFIVFDYFSRRQEALSAYRKALQEGKLLLSDMNETVVETKFEDIPKTWIKLFEGGNTGKLVTKLV
ncbi:NAD(P)-binding protein [Patellaria atrata CBS 101060]|uniref:NAD(P)-binding protein n=1 Tax=Patellaria atrata CBS 101060 TaxID=1346257 RepID=A0A9P4VRY3_9PEZI|nr:NAD(P)-binding protein [Patellaria atrata CBS 101060]